jgi:hypothetical protein
MNCRDVRDVADSFLRKELPSETNHEILWHLEICPSCRSEIEARRRLCSALRIAFNGDPGLQPTVEFTNRLRDQLREAAAPRVAAFLSRSRMLADALARDAIGDHRNCALKYRLIRTPVPLEEAAQRFDSTFRLLLSAPPDDISTADGVARVIDRHSCAYGARRFGHVVLQYRGRVVSLLGSMNGLSVVAVNGRHHAILLVGDLEGTELTALSRIVSLPLAQRLGRLNSDRGTPAAWLIAPPVAMLAWASPEH